MSERITEAEFVEPYCQRSRVSTEWLLARRRVVCCECGEDGCEGWAMVPIELALEAEAIRDAETKDLTPGT